MAEHIMMTKSQSTADYEVPEMVSAVNRPYDMIIVY
jgi:hypothetical protein